MLRAKRSARILIAGQAPGTKVHESGIPWNDRSGEVLRDWLDVDSDTFYDESRIAIVPMGFCYPGVDPRGGDNPPRPECAEAWHDPLLNRLPSVELILLVGMYAQARYLGKTRKKTLTASKSNNANSFRMSSNTHVAPSMSTKEATCLVSGKDIWAARLRIQRHPPVSTHRACRRCFIR